MDEVILFCPHCNEEIDEVKYTSVVNEYGTVHFVHHSSDSPYVYATDHECDDSETLSTEYSCPHCDREISVETVIVRSKKITPVETPSKDDAEQHTEIISPKLLSNSIEHLNAIICINKKCNKIIPVGIDGDSHGFVPPPWISDFRTWLQNLRKQKDSWKTAPVECPSCGMLNHPEKFFIKLLESKKKKLPT